MGQSNRLDFCVSLDGMGGYTDFTSNEGLPAAGRDADEMPGTEGSGFQQ